MPQFNNIADQNQVVRQLVASYGSELAQMAFEERRAACHYGHLSHIFPGTVEAVGHWKIEEDNVAVREVDIGEGLPPFKLFGYHVDGTVFVVDNIRIRSMTLN